MSLEIHKKGQGVWARSVAYVMGAALVLFGAWALYGTINRAGEGHLIDSELPVIGFVSYYKVIALLVAGAGLYGLHMFLNKPRSVDQLIETEQEMRRVSWPTLREVWNAAIVVVFLTMLLAVIMSGFDWVLRKLFHLVF
jgi:preprotein translocase SecE subunit